MTAVTSNASLDARDAQRMVSVIGDTPVVGIDVVVRPGVKRRIFLKLEGTNPGGSLKDRSAKSLIEDLLHRRGDAITTIVESTSGNLGVGLALSTLALGLRFIAVVDPKVTPTNIEKMRRYGAIIDMVSKDESEQSFLEQRLDRVAALVQEDPALAWTNQYENPANPMAHETGTAPELLFQMNNKVDAVFVATSTCGTLSGIGRHLRNQSPSTRIVAVDAEGSAIFTDQQSPRLLVGIGSSRKSRLLRPDLYDDYTHVNDGDAFAMAIALRDATGIWVGGSSGATLLAACRYAATAPADERIACICADTGANYTNTFFDPSWLSSKGLDKVEIPFDIL